MKASVLLKALDCGESVAIYCRGRKEDVLAPVQSSRTESGSALDHPAFGMWRDREMNVAEYVRDLRKGEA